MTDNADGLIDPNSRTLLVRRPTPTGATAHPRPQPTQCADASWGATYPEVAGYEILGVLGSGGMGVVFKARQLNLDRLVALKMIRPEAGNDPELLARFQAEASAIARLQHPGIVQVFEIGEHEGRPYICLEFVEGVTLADWIAGKPHDPRSVATLGEHLALALHHAHEQGIIHRDIKPANVLLDASQRPRLTDFGIAHFLQRDTQAITQNNDLLGTPSYMAPEQADKGKIQPATDVYALGVLLYEMLVGRPPFVAPTGLETIHLVLKADPVSPRRLQPSLPRDLETIVLKCLGKEPQHRYATAQDLATDLRRWLNGEPIRARPITAMDRLVRWCSRNPVIATLTTALSVALVTLVVMGTIWWRAAEARRGADEQQAAQRLIKRNQLILRLTEDLAQIETALREQQVGRANEVLHHARGLLHQDRELPEFGERLGQYQDLAHLVTTLDLVRSRLGQARGDSFDHAGRSDEYAALLAPLGVTLGRPLAEEWIEPLRKSIIRWKFIRAMDLWAVLRGSEGDQVGCDWLLELNNRIDPDRWCAEVRQAVIARDISELVRRAEQAHNEKHPRDHWRLLGPLLRLMNKPETAKQFYRAGLLQYPDDFLIANSLGLLLMNEENDNSRREALGCFRTALAIRPNSAGVQLNAGCMLAELNQHHEALAAYRRASELQPDYALAYYNQARTLSRLERRHEALPLYQRAIELNPNFAEAYFHLASLLAHFQNIAEMKTVLDQIEQRKLYRPDMGRHLVRLLEHHGHSDLALAVCERWIRLDPNQPRLLYDQGTALMDQSRYSEAELFLRLAIQSQPDYPESWCNLGLTLVELGKFEEAIEKLCHGHQLGMEQQNWRYPSDYWLAEAHALHLMDQRFSDRTEENNLETLDSQDLKRLGRLATIRQRYVLATRAYRSVAAHDPAGHWSAANAALRAALGQGQEPMPREMSQSYRDLALRLVSENLAQVERWLQEPTPETLRYLRSHLRNCLTTERMRDFRRLATGPLTPAGDRERWQALFLRADSLAAQTQRQLEAEAAR